MSHGWVIDNVHVKNDNIHYFHVHIQYVYTILKGEIFINIVLYNIMFKPILKLMVILWKEYITHMNEKRNPKNKM